MKKIYVKKIKEIKRRKKENEKNLSDMIAYMQKFEEKHGKYLFEWSDKIHNNEDLVKAFDVLFPIPKED